MKQARERHELESDTARADVVVARLSSADWQFLLELADRLRPMADATAIQDEVNRRLAEHLGAGRVFYAEISADGVLSISTDYCAANMPSSVGRRPLDDFGRRFADTLRAGRTLVVADTQAPGLLSADEAAVCRHNRIGADIKVPLIKKDALVALLAVHQRDIREWQDDEVALIEEVAERTWAVVERAKAEALSRDSESRFRHLFETMEQGYALVEMVRDGEGDAVDHRLLAVNPAYGRLVGVPSADAEGHCMRDLLPTLEPDITATFARIVRGGEPAHFERRVEALGHWFDVRAYPAGGDRLTVLFENIDNRKRAEAVLRGNQARQWFLLKFSDAVRGVAEPYAIADIALRLLAAHLRLDRACIASRADADAEVDIGPEYYRDDLGPMVEKVRQANFPDSIRLVREGTLTINDVADNPVLSPTEKHVLESFDIGAYIGAGLRDHEGELVWLLVVANAEPRTWAPHEAAMVEAVAERTWAAMERARNEMALQTQHELIRQQTRLFDQTLSSITDLTYTFDCEARIVYANKALLDLWGRSLDQVIGKTYFDVGYADEEAARLERQVREVITSQEVLRDESAWTTPSGETEYYEYILVPVLDAQSAVAVAGSSRKITQRKHAQLNAALLEQIEQDVAMQASADEIMAAVGVRLKKHFHLGECVFVDVDEARDEIVGRYGWNTRKTAQHRPRYRLAGTFTPEFIRACRAGQSVIVSDAAADPKANVAASAGLEVGAFVSVPYRVAHVWVGHLTLTDTAARSWRADEIDFFKQVTQRVFPRIERARTERVLRESERKYRTLFATMGQAFIEAEIIRDADGRAIDCRAIELNPACEHLLGVPLARARGRLASEVRPDLDRWWVATADRVIRRHRPEHAEREVAGRDRWFECYFYATEGDRFVVLFADVSARKRAENLLRASEIRQSFLLTLTDALRAVNDPLDAEQTVVETTMEHFQADRCYYGRIKDGEVAIHRDAARSGLSTVAGRYRLDEFMLFQRVVEEGTPFVIHNAHRSTILDAPLRALCLDLDAISFIDVPIIRNDQAVGLLCLVESQPRHWSRAEVQLVQEVAERSWAAIEGARAENIKRESEYRFRSLALVSSDAVYRMSADWRQMHNLDGKSFIPDTATGSNAWVERYIPAVDRDVVRHAIDEAIASKGVFELEHRIILVDGNIGWTFSRAVPLLDGEGAIREWIGTASNITERKRAEIAVREREERQAFLLQIFDAMREHADERDIGGVVTRMLAEHLGLDRCYVTWMALDRDRAWRGPEYRRDGLPPVFGTRGQMRRSNLPGIIRDMETATVVVNDSATDPSLSEAERVTIAHMRTQAFVVAPVREGERNFIWALVAGSAAARQWSAAEIQLVEDIAARACGFIERSRVEQALREREGQLTHANHAKDQFLAMLGHELRNPLAPITTTLQLMKLRAPETFVSERAVMEGQVRYLTGLVDDLLDVARIANGKIELQRKPVDIEDVAATAVETTRSALEERKQTLEVEVEPDLVVSGDRRRLVQILVNLLGNASKYSPAERSIYLSAVAEAGKAVLRVRDEGQGIAPELLPHVFESFSQEAQSIERAGGGLGLGLAIAQNLVQLHAGTVEAASGGRDQGSQFTVRLPLLEMQEVHEAPAPKAETPAVAPEGKANARVLIVDDYAPAADSLAMLLDAMGYQTCVARDGAEALKMFEDFDPQVALVDIGLPVMDGYEVARTVRATPEREKLPLIAVTGYGQASDHARVMEAGFDEHLVKPLDAARIGELIERLLTR